MVIQSLEKIVREELNRHSLQRRVNLNKREEEGEEEDVAVVFGLVFLY
jgi:ribosomal protein L18E